jgi:hypothetical protein
MPPTPGRLLAEGFAATRIPQVSELKTSPSDHSGPKLIGQGFSSPGAERRESCRSICGVEWTGAPSGRSPGQAREAPEVRFRPRARGALSAWHPVCSRTRRNAIVLEQQRGIVMSVGARERDEEVLGQSIEYIWHITLVFVYHTEPGIGRVWARRLCGGGVGRYH